MFRSIATALIVLIASLSWAQTTTFDAEIGWSDSRTSVSITGKDRSASLDLASRQTVYGFSAAAWTQPWAIRARYFWSQPNGRTYIIQESQWFGASKRDAISATLIGTANRSHEWQILCEPGWWETRAWRPMKPYFGYTRRSSGWTFFGQDTAKGQIDLSSRNEVWLIGLVCQPTPYPFRLEGDYGWLRTTFEGQRTGGSDNRADGVLKGHRWHLRAVTGWPVAPQWWVQFSAEKSWSRSSGQMNYTVDKESLTGDGNINGDEWRIIGAVRARW